MKTNEIRQRFLDYFEACGHERVASSSIIPHDDPSLMFTNAGMNQFKDVFLGQDKRAYVRATSSQLCVRAGGKHNDLDNVGYTARHHTCFEMLGNFSFGDYFKSEAIQFAWDFITKSLGISPDKLYVTVYEEDDDAAAIWQNEIGVAADRIIRCGEKDNFWSMGETGPCGPCTEIFYDHGPEIEGGLPGTPDQEKDRYVEIWNLVFMQYNRDADGAMTPLPKPSVDTGMGLERIAAVMQGVHNNYDIDLFQQLIQAAAKVLETKDLNQPALKVIADHLRTVCFLIAEGLLPSNEGRGYVLRRIMRRALRHGYEICGHTGFLHLLVETLVQEMGDVYPLLRDRLEHMQSVIQKEEQQFGQTLRYGIQYLEAALANTHGELDGAMAFKLYDTYGFPYDLTEAMCQEKGISLDQAGFEKAMQLQKDQSKKHQKFTQKESLPLDHVPETHFDGYTAMEQQASLLAIIHENESKKTLAIAEKALLVFDHTVFYPEGGGQVGDTGELKSGDAVFRVTDTQKFGKVIVHVGELLSGALSVGDAVTMQVDRMREETKKHHTATHLLHAALRTILGDSVAQKGSLVTPDRLRFDFTFHRPVDKHELKQVEAWVNERIYRAIAVETEIMAIDEAKAKGAMALFGEKYEDEVRVLSIGDDSIELCGGTHANQTSDLGLLMITNEAAVASGVRRIEAVTGVAAGQWVTDQRAILDQLASSMALKTTQLPEGVEKLQLRISQCEQEIAELKQVVAQTKSDQLEKGIEKINGIELSVKMLGLESDQLSQLSDEWVKHHECGVIVLISEEIPHRIIMQAGSNAKIHVGKLMKKILAELGGRGGGKPYFAQGGGLPEISESALTEVIKRELVA